MRTRELERRIEAYFAACDATRERVEQKNGGVQYRQVPYTLQGLAAETGLAKAELLAACGGASARARLLSGALRRIERHLVERALLGEIQATLAQILLRELGWTRRSRPRRPTGAGRSCWTTGRGGAADMKLMLEGRPNPRQAEFFASRARHTAYGGARGGGKSWAMRRKFVLLALRYDGLQLLLLRRTLPELYENHVRPLQRELHAVAPYNATQRVFAFPNGSRIRLGYCAEERDVYQYQGQEYDVIGLEEATHFTESQMQFLTTCNRSVRADFTPRMYYTCNPGGVGHGWVKRLFLDRAYRSGERPEDYAFIPARVFDNPVLLERNPEYVRTLEALPEPLRRAYLEGDWDVLAGQYFAEFRRDAHVIEPIALPGHWRRFAAMDWGYRDPCAVLWLAVSDGGRVYVYRELYLTRTLSSELARRIREAQGDERIAYTVASPDAWQTRGLQDVAGESIAH